MRILHICLACFYYENMGYQENLLPLYHKKLGNDVEILACAKNKINGKNDEIINNNYINKNGIPVKILRIQKNKLLNHFKLIKYKNLYEKIEFFEPDIIFVHGGQSGSLKIILKYIRKHKNVKLYIDQHGDYYNSPVSKFSSKINVRFFNGKYLRHSKKLVTKYWGTTPWRCQYLHEVYGIPEEKIDLLVMGGDDEKIRFDKKDEIKKEIRTSLNIPEDSFVITTGGKIDKTKNIHILAEAVNKLGNNNVHLIVFGSLADNAKELLESKLYNKNIHYIGWIESDKAYDYFLASDLAAFPGTHSVLWEQAVACRIPCAFKYWEGMTHVDIGGNCKFFKADTAEEIYSVLTEIINDETVYEKMLSAANGEKAKDFLYSNIAKKAIGLTDERN